VAAVHRLLTLLLVPAGVALGHGVGYLTDHGHAAAAHSYFPLFALTGLVIAVGVFAAAVVIERRGAAVAVDRRLLLTAQVGGFLGLEAVERAVAGLPVDAVLFERAVVVGVLAQAVVAALLALAVRTVPRLLAALVDPAPLALSAPVVVLLRGANAVRRVVPAPARPSAPRAPPLLLATR
jgi:hypothetical protein